MTGQSGVGAPGSSSSQASMAFHSLPCPPPTSPPGLTSVGLPPPNLPTPVFQETVSGYIWADLSPPAGSHSARSRPSAWWSDVRPRQAGFLQAVSPPRRRVKHPQLSAADSWGRSSCAQSHRTPCDRTDCSPPGSSVHGILQARALEWSWHFLLEGIFPAQGSNLHLLCLQYCRWVLCHCGEGQGDQQRNQSGKTPSRLLQQKAKLSSKKNKQREGNHEKRGEKERSHKHLQNKRIFPNVKCTDNLMEFTWFSPLRVWLQKIELQSHHHILDLLQLTCRQEERTITSTLRFHGYILNRGRIQTRIQDKLFPSSRKQSCDWAALFTDK